MTDLLINVLASMTSWMEETALGANSGCDVVLLGKAAVFSGGLTLCRGELVAADGALPASAR